MNATKIAAICAGMIISSMALAQNVYGDAAMGAVEKKGGKFFEKMRRIKECSENVGDCLNSEKVATKITAMTSKVGRANECLNSTDNGVQSECLEAGKKMYQARKEKKEKEALAEAERYRWDGNVGGEARICTRGKIKPVGVVLVITKTKIKLEINQAGGGYFVGQQTWVPIELVGC